MRVLNCLSSLAMLACAAAATAAPGAQPAADTSSRIFSAADLDRDGRITLEEFHKDIVRGWHALDLNGDGYITRDELASLPDKRMAEFVLSAFASADGQRGGRLSFRDVVERRMAFFDAADTDKSEWLSVEEVLAYDSKLRERASKLRKGLTR